MKKAVGFLLAVGLCILSIFSSFAFNVSYEGKTFTHYIVFSDSKGRYYFSVSDVPFSSYTSASNRFVVHNGDGRNSGAYDSLDDCLRDLQALDEENYGDYIVSSSTLVLLSYGQVLLYSNFDIINNDDGSVYFEANSNFGGNSGGGSLSFVYDSTIPAPENLTYISTKQLSQKLTWTNKLVDSYSVRVSANGRYNDQLTGKPEWHDYNLMIASDGSDGADAGVPASSGGITFSAVDMFQLIGDKYGTVSIKAFEPTEFRVQFYAYVEGVMQVGPVGVVRINKNSAGLWVGSTATVEYPADVGDLGSSGGLYPSGDAWTSDGQGFTDMDKDGNITGSGTVGDEESYVPVGSGPVSLGDFLKDMVNSLLNIPTVLSQLFNSIINAMSGMGELPALVASFFSFLPAEVVALVSLGIIITIVLRIFGR